MNTDAGSATGFAEATETEDTNAPQTWDVAKRDEINDLGFMSQQTADGWVAHEALGDDDAEAIGPFETIGELLTAVKKHVEEHGINAIAEEDKPIITQLESGSFTAYRASAPQITGAGLTREEALYDLKVAEDEAKAETETGADDDMDEVERVIAGEPLAVGSTDIVDADEDEIDDEADDSEPIGRDIGDGNVELFADSGGKPYLPGVAPVINRELAQAIYNSHSLHEDLDALKKQVKAADEYLEVTCHKYEGFFSDDPDNSNQKIYKAGDLAAVIMNTEKITTRVCLASEDDEMPGKDR